MNTFRKLGIMVISAVFVVMGIVAVKPHKVSAHWGYPYYHYPYYRYHYPYPYYRYSYPYYSYGYPYYGGYGYGGYGAGNIDGGYNIPYSPY